VRLEVVGPRQAGHRARPFGALAQRGVSIEELHTEIVSGAMSAEHLFKVKAVLLVPKSVSNDDVRGALEALANEMMVDVALGEQA
jgi:glycine cleavage system regulatory protein